MSTLPQWKVQLLERKRRDEEEGRRREQEELERLARMPAWKREIIERRRARLCSGSSLSESPADGQAGPGPGGSGEDEGAERPSDPQPEACDAKAREGAVLRENIGPLHQNHFIQQEKQRKEGPQEPEQPPRGHQVSELLSQVTGVKTVWSDNITITESVPVCREHRDEQETPNGLSAKPSEGRLHIQSSLSRSVEDLNTFERGRGREEEEEEEEEKVPGRGRVSRLLFKFGQRGGAGGHPRPTRSRSTENIIERSSRAGAQSSKDGASRLAYRPSARSPSPPPLAARRSSGTETSPRPLQTVAAFRDRFEAQSAGVRRQGPKRTNSPCRLPEAGRPSALPAPDTTELSRGLPASTQATQCQTEGEMGHTADHPAATSATRAGSQERPVSNGEDSRAGEPQLRTDQGQDWRPAAPSGLEGIVEAKPVPSAEAQALAELRAHSKKSFPHGRQEAPPEQEAEALASSQPNNTTSANYHFKPQPVSTVSSSCGEQASVSLAAATAASCLSAAPDQRDTDNGSRDWQDELGPDSPQLPELRQERVHDAGEEAPGEPGMSRLYGIKPPSVGPARSPAASPEEVRLPAFGVRAGSSPFNRLASSPAPTGSKPPAQHSAPPTEVDADDQGRKGIWAQLRPRDGTPAGSESPPGSTARASRSGGPQRKSGKTITINPRKMAANKTPPASGVTAENGVAPLPGTQPAAVPGAPTKKRYPTVEEIQVIGGYLTLRRSCLVKTGGSRGKLTISFNDCELESTFEYPSELTLLAELGPDQEEEPSQTREAEEEEEVEEQALARRLGVDKTSTVGTAIRRKPRFVDENCR
ncbi:uncharacterized protein LOC144496873 [Mustelus asterias]